MRNNGREKKREIAEDVGEAYVREWSVNITVRDRRKGEK